MFFFLKLLCQLLHSHQENGHHEHTQSASLAILDGNWLQILPQYAIIENLYTSISVKKHNGFKLMKTFQQNICRSTPGTFR